MKARWIGSIFHLAAFFALSRFAVGRCSFGRTSDFYVHFEVLPPSTGKTVAFFLDLFPHKFNILSLCDSYVVLRPVHAFYGEVASDTVNKAETGVEDFEDGP